MALEPGLLGTDVSGVGAINVGAADGVGFVGEGGNDGSMNALRVANPMTTPATNREIDAAPTDRRLVDGKDRITNNAIEVANSAPAVINRKSSFFEPTASKISASPATIPTMSAIKPSI